MTTSIAGYDMEVSELAGWNLNIHNRYNFHQGILQKGDGSAVFFKQQARLANTLIGGLDQGPRPFNCPVNECEGPAKNNHLLNPVSMTSGPDGSLYVGDGNLIRRITPDGYIFTVFKFSEKNSNNRMSGSSSPSSSSVSSMTSGKGSPSSASLSSSSGSSSFNYHVALSQYDNHLYIADAERHQILRIHSTDRVEDPESNYDVFVGSGVRCLPRDASHCGDGGSAMEAKLSFPKGMAFTFDGSLYFADGNSIRVVNRRGLIQTVIGDRVVSSPASSSSQDRSNNKQRSQQWKPIPCGEAVPSEEVTLRWPSELSVHPVDGSIYFLDDSMLLRLLPDHRVMVVVGLPSYCKSSTSGPRSSSFSSSSSLGGSRGRSRHLNDEDSEFEDQEEEEIVMSSLTSVSSASSSKKSVLRKPRAPLSPETTETGRLKRRLNVDIGSVISFAFSSIGDLFVASVDDDGIHRVYLVRDTKQRQEVVHFMGSNQGRHFESLHPSSLRTSICEVETCRDVDGRNCSCALASNEMMASFTGQSVKVSLATETPLSSITSIAVTPDGVVHVADDVNFRIVSANYYIPGPDENLLFSMTSPGSKEVYIFNKYGQHVFTKNAVTGQVLFTFTYDVDTSFGRVSSVTDVKGSRVSFMRDSSRNLASVESGSGSKCRVSVNNQGMLESFVDPDNLTTRFFYEPSTGLMNTRRDSSGFNLFYKYDSNGRLVGVIADSFWRMRSQDGLEKRAIQFAIQSLSLRQRDCHSLSKVKVKGRDKNQIRMLSHSKCYHSWADVSHLDYRMKWRCQERLTSWEWPHTEVISRKSCRESHLEEET